MPVQIIFADGSKRMAHNLDDSRLRWHERKVYEVEQVREIASLGITVRDCSAPKDLDQAWIWREELIAQKTALLQYNDILRAAYDKQTYFKRAMSVIIALREIKAQLEVSGIQITRMNQAKSLKSETREQKIERIKLANAAQETQQKQYITYLRTSLENMLKVISDEQAKEMITELLNHKSTDGFEPMLAQALASPSLSPAPPPPPTSAHEKPPTEEQP